MKTKPFLFVLLIGTSLLLASAMNSAAQRPLRPSAIPIPPPPDNTSTGTVSPR